MILPNIPYKIPTGQYVARTLYLVDNSSHEDWFVFSVIERLEPDMQDYNEGLIFERSKGSGGNKYKLYFLSCKVDVSESLISNPIGNLKMNSGRDEFFLQFFNKTFASEPSGEAYFTLPSGCDKGVGRVMPQRPGPFYVKTYIDENRDVLKEINKEPYLQKQITELSNKYFGIDLWEYKEHVGNCYLLWHNELFKGFSIKGCNRPNGIIVDIDYRTDHYKPFKVRLCDKRQRDYVVADYMWDIPAGTRSVFIPTECFPSFNQLSFYSEDGVLIFHSYPANFVTFIATRIGIAEKAIAIKVKDENGNEKTLEPINKFKYHESLIGKKCHNIDSYFSINEEYHYIKELEESREFIFFNGSKDNIEKSINKQKAKKAVIDIINRAHDVCYICDPYFNENDFIEFATKAESLDVKIRIINSKADLGQKRLLILKELISNYNKELRIDDHISCRTLRGGESMLHDRFIIIDERVWYLGSSFSEFGTRACSLALLSNSASMAIKTYIEEWWNSDEFSISLDNIQ